MKRRARKQTTALLNDSLALIRSVREQLAVLQAWHPNSILLTIAEQQTDAFLRDLSAPQEPQA